MSSQNRKEKAKRCGPSFDVSNLKINTNSGEDSNSNNINKYSVKEIKNYTMTSQKFKLSRHVSEFKFPTLRNIHDDPFEALDKYVNECVEKTIEEAAEKFGIVNKIGFKVVSDHLDYYMCIPLSDLTKNSVDAFLNRFELVEVFI